MLLSRIALLSVLAAAANASYECELHPTCRTAICSIFDDVCEEGEICQQLDGSEGLWYRCHAENELDNCDNHGCGEDTECHQVGPNSIFCTCDGMVVPAGENCQDSEDFMCDLICHESADCETDGVIQLCICKDDMGTVVGEGMECPDEEEEEWIPDEEEELFDAFDCTICSNNLACVMYEQDVYDPGCYCNGVRVPPDYPCSYDEESPMDCENYCTGDLSSCYMEHGVPTCRCDDGDKVEPNVDCSDERNEYTEFFGQACEFDVCGDGAECHYSQNEGFLCTCYTGTDEQFITSHYSSCP